MTEREVIEKQEGNGNKEYYLILIGSFLHAYGNGAFALARATGYKVKRKHRKLGEVLTAGFPATRIDQVMEKIVAAGGEAAPLEDGKTWLFKGIDGTPDESMIAEPDWKALPPNHFLFYNGEVGLPVRNVVPEAVREAFPLSSSPCKGEVSEGRRGNDFHWLADALRNFNLSAATPLEAMMFVGDLQVKLKD